MKVPEIIPVEPDTDNAVVGRNNEEFINPPALKWRVFIFEKDSPPGFNAFSFSRKRA